MNVFDFGLDPQEAVNVPHSQNTNSSSSTSATVLEAPIPGGLVGGADMRRDGAIGGR
ncbi:hypothetical protein [Marinobacter antarcticus]|uniref:Uncharacterized protein n=1 Tax=Marinobacter antarcticus TaxID=564117 RepID=A0A831R7N8_9GAMM|nr:hypothetical protein [Marinobacter antarcticus]HEA53749.1 hypothetical protein [Marinobacter antarcticus]